MMTTDWPVHPAAELFPILVDSDLAELAEDIRAHGLLEPVTLWTDNGDVVLLDGRNRLAACRIAGVEPTTRMYDGDNPIDFVVSENVKRRHLNDGQRAGVAAKLLPLYEAEAAKRKGGRPRKDDQKPGADRPQVKRAPRSRDRAATATGTSGRSVARYKRVAEQDEGLAAKVDAGEVALDRAERIIRDREAEARKVAEAKAAAEAAPIELTVDLRHGDLRTVLDDIDAGTVDAIITDPPYPREFVPLYEDLAKLADRVLTEDGVLVVLTGQVHLPAVMALLDCGRPYRWTCALLTTGPGYVAHQARVQSMWKPLLIYGGGPRIGDLFQSEGTDANAKTLHRWGQDYAAFHSIVGRFTSAGQTVLDPFMGSGTTLLAAHAQGRHVIGCDVDDVAVATARERLSG